MPSTAAIEITMRGLNALLRSGFGPDSVTPCVQTGGGCTGTVIELHAIPTGRETGAYLLITIADEAEAPTHPTDERVCIGLHDLDGAIDGATYHDSLAEGVAWLLANVSVCRSMIAVRAVFVRAQQRAADTLKTYMVPVYWTEECTVRGRREIKARSAADAEQIALDPCLAEELGGEHVTDHRDDFEEVESQSDYRIAEELATEECAA